MTPLKKIILKNDYNFLNDFIKFYILKLSLNKKHYKEIQDSDLVILNGEGSIHSSNVEVVKWLFYLYTSKKLFKKTVYTINQTIQFDDKESEILIPKIYKICDMHLVRDPFTLKLLKEKKVENVNLTGDAAFVETKYEENKAETLLEKLKLEKDGFILLAGSIVFNKLSLEDNVRLINFLREKYNKKIIFTASCSIDIVRMEELKKVLPDLIFVDNEYNYNDIMNLIKNSFIFITGRFHPMIFSIVLGKAFIPLISNTYKMKGVLEMIDYPLEAFDFTKSNLDDLYNYIEIAISEKQKIEFSLLEKSDYIIKKTKKGYEELLTSE